MQLDVFPKKHVFLGLFLFAAGCGFSIAAELPLGRVSCGTPKSVHDGDTFRYLSGEKNFPVRVAGIDAPETGQAFWRVSRDMLRSQLAQGSLVDCYKVDEKYSRQVCRVTTSEWHDIALELVRTGLAWHTVKYRDEQTPHEQERYSAAEASARVRSLGLWSLPDPQEPEECRALKKQRVKCR